MSDVRSHPATLDGAQDVASLLAWGMEALPESGTGSLDAQLLLAHAVERERSWVLAHGEERLSDRQAGAFRSLVRRRAEGEPVAYLRGHVEWFGMDLRVGPEVLIPRPETELLAEEAVRLARERGMTCVADIGTGSGCVAVQLARALPGAHVVATDASEAALRVARDNISRHGVSERVDLRLGHLDEPLTAAPELVTANLPYLGDEMMSALPRDVQFEPRESLHGGRDGLDLYRELLRRLRARHWEPLLLFEIAPCQSASAIEMVGTDGGRTGVRVCRDYSGRDRFLVVGG